MAFGSFATAGKIFVAFAAVDLGALLVLASVAVREAREADPAGLILVFGAMQGAAICGLALLVLWLLAAAVRAPIQSGLRWYRRNISSREASHVEA